MERRNAPTSRAPRAGRSTAGAAHGQGGVPTFLPPRISEATKATPVSATHTAQVAFIAATNGSECSALGVASGSPEAYRKATVLEPCAGPPHEALAVRPFGPREQMTGVGEAGRLP
jgi:hypothetical protein